ncbi:MAG: DUF4870 domain-containing protein [Planctomycetaceae bacterium]|nr:DUF4870 domain-containing protein [Planctomycetaceae bacterium]
MSDQNPYDVPPQPTPLEDWESEPNADDRNLALIAHLSGAAGIVAGGLIGFLGPLIIYLMSRERSPYVVGQAKEALNFQITLILAGVVFGLLTAVSCGLLFPLLFVPVALQVVFAIIAAIAVRDGEPYRYPFCIRLLQ